MCRGFAFVDFLSKQEARSAADAVAGTHLYGRRLVRRYSAVQLQQHAKRNELAGAVLTHTRTKVPLQVSRSITIR